MVTSTIDIEGLHHNRLLNRCLLFAALLFGGLLVAGLTTLPSSTLQRSIVPVAIPSAGVVWLIVAYLFGRWRRPHIASALIVALMMLAVALAVYLLPDYTALLLPVALLPVALAALLLDRRAIYVVAVITALAVLGAYELARIVPLSLGVALPTPNSWLMFGVLAGTLLFMAFILAPLRTSVATVTTEMQQVVAARDQEVQARQVAEQRGVELQGRLDQQQQQLASIAQAVSDGLIAVNNGQIVRANDLARQIWAHVAATNLTEQPFALVRSTLSGPTASLQHVEIVELPPESMARDGYTHVLRDLREQAHYARLRGELIGLLTDEMRNPLTSVLTALDLTLGQQNLPDDLDRVLLGARQSGQRLLGLVTTLLEISQIQQKPQVLHFAPVKLSRIIEAGIAQLAPLAQQGAVTVVVEYGSEATVLVDSDRVQRAFGYLLEHALRHSPSYSTVQVRTARQNDFVEVRIVDQGAGIPAEQRDALFDQLSVTDQRGAPALGLAFSKLVIEAHGGRVRVDANTGQGSTYIFTLPLEKS